MQFGRIWRGCDNEQLAIRPHASNNRTKRFAAGRGGEHNTGAAQAHEFLSRIGGLSVYVLIGAQTPGQLFFVCATRNSNRLEPHTVGELDAKVAQATQTLNSHEITRSSPTIAQRIKGGDASAHERSRFRRIESLGHERKRLLRRHHVLSVPTIIGDTCDLFILAVDEISTATSGANEVMASMPADTHPLSRAPGMHIRAERVDYPDHLMSRNTWIGDRIWLSLFHEDITVAHATRFHFDTHLSGLRLRYRALDDLEWAACF